MPDTNEYTAVRMILTELIVPMGEDSPKILGNVGRNLANEWIKDKNFSTPQELMEAIAKYFQDEIDLADSVKLEMHGDTGATLHFEGCKPCCGVYLKPRGGTPFCPLSTFPTTALRKAGVSKKNTLEGITKDKDPDDKVKVGICHQKFSWELK